MHGAIYIVGLSRSESQDNNDMYTSNLLPRYELMFIQSVRIIKKTVKRAKVFYTIKEKKSHKIIYIKITGVADSSAAISGLPTNQQIMGGKHFEFCYIRRNQDRQLCK